MQKIKHAHQKEVTLIDTYRYISGHVIRMTNGGCHLKAFLSMEVLVKKEVAIAMKINVFH